MSDDLVKRLRKRKLRVMSDAYEAIYEACDRIEQLEAALTHIWAFYPINVSNPHETIDAIRNFASNALEEKKDER